MAVKFSNNARTNLSSAILSTATSITVNDATVFPTLGASDHTFVTIESLDAVPTREIVKVTAIDTSTDALTVVRGQDGTTAAAFSSGAKVELRLTAALLNAVADDTDTESVSISGDTMTGNLAFADGVEARFGTDNDMGLFHSAGTSHIRINSGTFKLRSDDMRFTAQNGTTEFLTLASSGATFAGGKVTVSGDSNSYSTAPVVYFDSTSTANAGVRDWAIGPADDSYGNFHIFVGATTGADPVGASGRVFTISNAGNVSLAGTISSGAITSSGNIQQNYGNELRGKDSGGTARTLLRTNSNKLQIGWSYAGDVEFMGGGSYTKRMAISGSTGDVSIVNDLSVSGSITSSGNLDLPTSGSKITLNAYSTSQEGGGIFFRDGFDTSYKYNLSIMARSRSDDGSADGLSINGYEGVAFSTGSNTYNERLYLHTTAAFSVPITTTGGITSSDNIVNDIGASGNDSFIELKNTGYTGNITSLRQNADSSRSELNSTERPIYIQAGSGGGATGAEVRLYANQQLGYKLDANKASTFYGTVTAPTLISGAYGAGGTAGDGFRINSTDIYGQKDSVDKIHLSAPNGNAYFAGSVTVGGSITKTGDLTVDVSGEIILDSDAEFVRIYHDGGWVGGFQLTNNDFIIRSAVQDKDIIFKGNDGGSVITALTLDMSAGGNGTFAGNVGVGGATPNSYSGYGSLTISGSTGSLIDLEVGGTLTGEMFVDSSGFGFQTVQADDDILFKGNDGGSTITALTLDMSNGGQAIFNKGASFSDHVYLGDNDHLVLGGGDDLRIYHSGTESWIKDSGTGNLYIDTNGAAIQLTSGNTAKNMIVASADGGVTLYHNNSVKLNTSSTGVVLTSPAGGGQAVDLDFLSTNTSGFGSGLAIDSRIRSVTAGSSNAYHSQLEFYTNSTSNVLTKRMQLNSDGALVLNDSGGDAQLYLGGTSGTSRMYLARSGADTLLWNVSNGSMRFGTNNLERIKIDLTGNIVVNDSSYDADFRIESDGNANMFLLDGGTNTVNIGSATGKQTAAHLNVRKNGGAIEFGHGNNTSGYYGTLGSYGNNGMPYIGFSTYSETNLNTFTTNGFAGNIIVSDQGNLQFNQVTNSSATGQTPVRRMTLTTSGRLGINDASPSEILTVGGVIAASASSYTVNATTANFGFYNGGGTDTAYVQMPASGKFEIWKPNTGAFFIADSGGRIGIQKHPVSTVSLSIKAQATSNSSYGLEVTNASSNTRFLVDGTGNSYFYKTDNAVGMRWDTSNSRLGVNVSSPSMTLDVRGNARIGDGVSGEQDIYFAAGSGAWQVGTNASGNGTSNNQFYIYDSAYRFTVQKGTGYTGIGTNSPSALLHVQSNDSTTNATVELLRLTALSTGTTTTGFGPEIRFQAERNNGNLQNTGSIASVAEVNSGTNISSALVFKSGNVGVLSEGMRLNKDQQLLIGTQTINPQAGSSNTGVQIGDGFIGIGRDNAEPLILNRHTADGNMILFRRDGTTTGWFGTANNGDLFIGNDDTGFLFAGGSDAIIPFNPSGATFRDGVIKLGLSTHRWRSLNLSAEDPTSSDTSQIRFLTTAGSSLADAAITTSNDSGGTDLLLGSNFRWNNGSFTRFDSSRSGSGIRLGYTGNMRFYTESGSTQPTERMVLDSAGNLLLYNGSPEIHIGTTSASHYNWRIAAQEVVDAAFEIASGTQTAGSGAAGDSYTTRFVVHADGNVSIGNVAKSNGLLSIHGSKSSAGDLWTQVGPNNNASLILRNTSATNNTNAAIYFGNNSGVYAAINARFVDQTSEHTELRFSTTNTSGTSRERAVLNGSGYLGVGRTTAYYGLDLTAPGNNLARLLSSSGDALVRIIANNYATEADARLFLGEADTYGMTFEYDGNANIGYIGMNDNVDPTGSYSKRIQFPRYNTHTSFMAGNVGIGSDAPPAPLTVQADSGAGVARFIGRSSDNIASLGFYNNAQTSDIYIQSNGSWFRARADSGFHFRRGGTPAATDADGFTINGLNVGINNDNPQYKLDIWEAYNDVTMRLHRPSSGLASTDCVGIGFSQRSDTNVPTSDTRAGIFSTYNGNLFLATEPGGNLNSNPGDHSALMITGTSQDIGIGNVSPSSKLHITTSGGSTTAPNVVLTVQADTSSTITTGGGTAIKFKGVSSGGNIQNYDQAMIASLGQATNNGHGLDFYIKPHGSAALTKAVTITSGKVLNAVGGYQQNGTTVIDSSSKHLASDGSSSTPSYTFSSDTDTGFYRSGSGKVSLSSNGTQAMEFKNYGIDMSMNSNSWLDMNKSAWITFFGNGSAYHAIGSRNVTGSADNDIRINTYRGFHVNLDSNNNDVTYADFIVGKHGGISSTIYQYFKVEGETGNVTAAGTITASTTVSDIRRKENVSRIPDALEKVKQLDGICFNFIGDETPMTGLIAQQVQEVLPPAVYETELLNGEKTLALHYGNMVGLLVESIKTLEAQVSALTKTIEEMQNGSNKDK